MSSLFPLAFPILFGGMWAGVSYLLSRLSGWRALADRYRCADSPDGERLLWTSGQIGGVSFRSCLNVTLGHDALFLVPSLPFRMFMPLLRVPWTDVRFEGFTRMFFLEFACFRLGAEGPIYAVYRRTGDRLRPSLTETARADYESRGEFVGSLIDRKILLVALCAAAAGIVAALIAAKR
jgi:hypothetical protein